ncbi:MAG: YolD-like family protein [Clostridia bacterium]|nr:YolD-like family protein [Clostridia bacterium]
MKNNRMSREERARQFMPFDALDGFRSMISEQQKTIEPKKELSEEQMEILNDKVRRIKKGMRVEVTYYDKDGYAKKDGIISELDFTMKYIRVVDKKIFFEDVYEVEFP